MITANASGVLRNLGEITANDSGVLKKLSTVHANDSGVLRQIFSASQPVSELNVGDKVKLRTTTGSAYSFIVVHKGKPSSIYDDSCDGIWIVKETPYGGSMPWTYDDPVNNIYDYSDARARASNFYSEIAKEIRPAFKHVRIPYYAAKKSTGGRGTLQYGSNGSLTYFFMLSHCEYGSGSSEDGAPLSYFSSYERRICYYGGEGVPQWTRTPSSGSDVKYVDTVTKTGSLVVSSYCGSDVSSNNFKYVRPAGILSYSAGVDKDGYITV